MKTRYQFPATMVVALIFMTALGCGDSEPVAQPAPSVAAVPAPPPPVPPAPAPVVPATNPTVQPNTDAGATTPETQPAGGENTEVVTAEVGFGKKGHYDSNDYISVAVSTQFRVQERLTLLRITQALQQYKAVHERYPKTHEEFWKKIIEANSISLPELRNGEIFRYDPELADETDGEQSLQILKPKKQ